MFSKLVKVCIQLINGSNKFKFDLNRGIIGLL